MDSDVEGQTVQDSPRGGQTGEVEAGSTSIQARFNGLMSQYQRTLSENRELKAQVQAQVQSIGSDAGDEPSQEAQPQAADELEQLRAEVASLREALQDAPPPRMDPNSARRSLGYRQPSTLDTLGPVFDQIETEWLTRRG